MPAIASRGSLQSTKSRPAPKLTLSVTKALDIQPPSDCSQEVLSPWPIAPEATLSPSSLHTDSKLPRVGSAKSNRKQAGIAHNSSTMKSKLKDAILGKTHKRTKTDILSRVGGLKSALKVVGKL